MSGENSGSSGVLTGFKAFLLRGNVVELAVAVVIGTAFSKIVDSVVKGFVNPLVGAVGTKNLDDYRSCLRGPCETDPATGEILTGVPISWGAVLSASLTFLITAAVVYFLMILPMTKYKERQAAKNPVAEVEAGPSEVQLLTEIRDALVSQRDGSVAEGAGGPPLVAPRDGGTGPK
ncbi:large conductance mechanosensitive channel protein MscL [Streptomyces sp. N2-109]|uniref:Large-conductance mechanosensitive channel n=1 Tax=Streptomyces gossypii TaxID=2883101 RepID=A0ABT2JYX0_9ACTN|nr:large conductance mechanosensitive channel protein MscL [Streptomyces gossypii]MCT2593100.1 large conductance mechanosensitive channel protein MscL [Streptomyces gossypii]